MKLLKKIKWILPIILALAFLLSITQVHATTTYNWVQNSGFEEVGGNLLNDASFELGNFTYWEDHGGLFTDAQNHSGLLSCDLNGAGMGTNYVFSEPINGSFITSFALWAKQDGSGVQLAVRVYNNDSSYNGGGAVSVTTSWVQYDFTGSIDPAKFVSYIQIYEYIGSGYHSLWVDDVYFGVIGSGGQNNVSFFGETFPWFNMDVAKTDLYSNISTSFGHTGICSYYTYSMPYGAFPLMQKIDYLDSNTVSEVSLWVYSSVANCRIKFSIVYSSGSLVYLIQNITNILTWKKLTFNGLILPNGLIEGISISVLDGDTSQFTNLDDVSILSSTMAGVSVFTWDINPAPLSRDNSSFTAWQRTPYVFTGFIHNATGYINGTGTYTLTSSTGTQTGIITDGVFSLTLSERVGITELPLIELLRFAIVSDNGNFTVTVHAIWDYVYVDAPPSPVGIGIPIEVMQFLNLLYVFAVVFVPPLVTSVLVRKVKGDAMVGFIAGLALSIVAGIITKIVPVWGLFVIVLVLAYSIFAKVREK